jgi:hypothetical protein
LKGQCKQNEIGKDLDLSFEGSLNERRMENSEGSSCIGIQGKVLVGEIEGRANR